MLDGKWIPGLRPDMQVVAAARHVLLVRLAAVRERLPGAVERADEDPEHVHQLRVSTRRAGAALRIFAACLSEKAHGRLRRRLRKIRRAAGAARDWDVFLEEIGARLRSAAPRHKSGLQMLLGIGHGQRMAAQDALAAFGAEATYRFQEIADATVAALGPPATPAEGPKVLQDLARPLLGDLVRELEDAAAGDMSDYEHLHRVRILGKRLRYAMEVFACCFDDAFRTKHYAAVEQMQEMLGDANDSYVARERLAAIGRRLQVAEAAGWPRYRVGIEALAKAHDKRLGERRAAFLKWWQRWQRGAGKQLRAAAHRNGARTDES